MKNLQNQISILLVESNSGWLIGVYSALQEAGHDVLIATGADEGFCFARRVRPDLIISEIALPDISGAQLCRMIRADKHLHDTLFVLIGESPEPEIDAAIEGFDAGADDYFAEDFSPQFVSAKVERLIELQRSEDEIRFDYQMLHRSERHLAKIIEDTSKLIASIDLPDKRRASANPYAPKSKTFFDLTPEPKKQKMEKTLYSSKKNADALAAWKQSLKIKDFDNADEFEKESRGKVFYEIAP